MIETAARGTTDLDPNQLEAHCLAELERWAVPGIEVIAIKGGQVLFAGGFGRRRLEPDLPVTDETVFAHGSTGKAFTAFLISTLVDEGLLSLDTPIREYLPELRLADSAVADRVTLRDLLSHRSGLPRHDLAWIAHPSESRAALLRRLRHLPLSKDLRQTFQYSNWGFILAGHIVEVVTGSTYEEQLARRVFEPLGFQRTYVECAAVQALADHAEPYREKDGQALAIPWRPLDNAAPAGGIMSCARDTARWLLTQLGGGELEGRRILSEAAFKETHTFQMPTPAMTDEEYSISGYGLGWCIGTYRGRRLVWHNGGIDGFYTEFIVLPDDGIAVGTCNNAGRAISQAVARHVADLLLGAETRDWSGHLLERDAKARAAESKPEAIVGTNPSHALDDYVGTYAHPGYGDLKIGLAEGELTACVGELDLVARRRHYDTWDLSLATLAETGISASFYSDASGSVTDVFLPLEPTVEPIRFRRQPDSQLSNPEFLQGLAGVYEAGDVRLEITVGPNGRLLVSQAGQQAELEPAAQLTFAIAGMPGVQLKFELDPSGRALAVSTQGLSVPRVAE